MTLLVFAKAFVAQHTRKTKNGNTITIQAYYDKRVKKAAVHAPDHTHNVAHLSDNDKAKFSNMHKEQHVAHFYESHALSRKLDTEKQLLATLERSAQGHEERGDKKSVIIVHNKILKLKTVIMRHEKMLTRAKMISEGIGDMKHKMVDGSGTLAGDADKEHAGYVAKMGERFKSNKQVKEVEAAKPSESPKATESDYHYEEAQKAYQHSNRSGAAVGREHFVKFINENYDKLNNNLNPEQKQKLDSEFINLKKEYLEQEKNVLRTRSGVVSAHIAGNSKFKQSTSDSTENRLVSTGNHFAEWQDLAIKKIAGDLKQLRNDDQLSSDTNSVKGEAIKKAKKALINDISYLNTPGWDKASSRKGVKKSLDAFKAIDADEAKNYLAKIDAAFVENGKSLKQVVGAKTDLWKEIDAFMGEANNTSQSTTQPAKQAQHELVEHITQKGKTIKGVIRKDLTKAQAQAIDPYTFKKDGGYFIREKYLTGDVGEQAKAPTPQTEAQINSQKVKTARDAALSHYKVYRDTDYKGVDEKHVKALVNGFYRPNSSNVLHEQFKEIMGGKFDARNYLTFENMALLESAGLIDKHDNHYDTKLTRKGQDILKSTYEGLVRAKAQPKAAVEPPKQSTSILLEERDKNDPNGTIRRGLYKEPNGEYQAMTSTQSKYFKTEKGAKEWLERVSGKPVNVEPVAKEKSPAQTTSTQSRADSEKFKRAEKSAAVNRERGAARLEAAAAEREGYDHYNESPYLQEEARKLRAGAEKIRANNSQPEPAGAVDSEKSKQKTKSSDKPISTKSTAKQVIAKFKKLGFVASSDGFNRIRVRPTLDGRPSSSPVYYERRGEGSEWKIDKWSVPETDEYTSVAYPDQHRDVLAFLDAHKTMWGDSTPMAKSLILFFKSTPTLNLNQLSHRAATSPRNHLPEPSQAINGHLTINGLNIAIENPQGSQRTGVDRDGNEWAQTLTNHYGYIKQTTGADDDELDVFVNPEIEPDFNGMVYVVNQKHTDTGDFDEHKIMLGYDGFAEAKQAYLSNYEDGWQGVDSIAIMDMDGFKEWLNGADTLQPLDIDNSKVIYANA